MVNDQLDTQINAKGVRDYIKAARILSNNQGAPVGPILMCRGQALEIALKLFLERRGLLDLKKKHRHHRLANLYADCTNAPNPLTLTSDQVRVIDELHRHHYWDGDLRYTSRYRPNRGRVVTSPGQDAVEGLVETILTQANNQ